MILRPLLALFITLLLVLPTSAAQCGGNFGTFIGQMAR
jgi:hypothetical protein